MKKILVLAFISAALLTACGSGLTIGGVGIPGGAKDAQTREMGANTQLVYMTSGTMAEACDAQLKLITNAGWTQSGGPSTEETYETITYVNGEKTLTLMCSEQRDDGNFLGTKVTMTLQGGSK